MSRNTKLSPLARIAVGALEDLKGHDITVLDVQPLTTVTDTMIVCTGSSNRHVKSLAQNVVESAKESGTRALGVEGSEQGEWVLVDLGGVVVHVMQAQARAFYQLEKLWALPEPSVEEARPKKVRPATKAAAKGGAKPAGKTAGKTGAGKRPSRAAAATGGPSKKSGKTTSKTTGKATGKTTAYTTAKSTGTRKPPSKLAAKPASKAAAARGKLPAQGAARKKSAVAKAPARKSAAKKAPARKAPAKKTAVRKAPARGRK